MCKNDFGIEKTKTEKIKSFFPGKNSKMEKSPTFFYHFPYESYEKKSSHEVEDIDYIHNTYGTSTVQGVLYIKFYTYFGKSSSASRVSK